MSEPVVAIVVAAGLGLRYGGPVPKPALQIDGRSLISWSVEALAAGGCTHAVAVVNPQVAALLDDELSALPIPVFRTSGGQSRQESVFRGLRLIRESPELADATTVLIHDAVRPLVPPGVVSAVIRAVQAGADAVIPVIRVVDSMRLVADDGTSEPIDRTTLRAVQTPQGFPLGVIWEAHQAMAAHPAQFTDDASCAERLGHAVTLVEGSPLAMKVTTPADLVVLKALWSQAQQPDDKEER